MPAAPLTAYLLRLADIQEELKLFLFITFTANLTRHRPCRNGSISRQLYTLNSVIFCLDIGEHHRWIEKYGIPRGIYVDRKTVYVPDEKLEQQAKEEGREHYTQFGRACASLGIRLIRAYSPQAKGRVERSHGTYQDRLVKELRLKEISTIELANQFLAGEFTERLNDKFAIEPRESADYHLSCADYDLPSIFCIEEDRVITSDWIVRFNNRLYQLKRQSAAAPAKANVKVRQYLSGEVHINYRGQDMKYEILEEAPAAKRKEKEKKNPHPSISRKPRYVPPPDHPWR